MLFVEEQMAGSYAQVCHKDARDCKKCKEFSPIKAGNWAKSICEKKLGLKSEVIVRSQNNKQLIICEIRINGIPLIY